MVGFLFSALAAMLAIHASAHSGEYSSARASSPDSTGESGAYPPLQLQRWIKRALQYNPDLQAMAWQAEAVHAKADQHEFWEAPDMAVEFYKAPTQSFPNPLRDQEEIDYSLQQSLPWPGRRKIVAKPMHIEGEVMEGVLRSEGLRLTRDVSQAYARLAWQQGLLSLKAGAAEEARLLFEVLRKRYEGGENSQAEVLMAQNEISALEAETDQIEADRSESQAEIKRLLGLFPDTATKVHSDSLSAIPPVPPLSPVASTLPAWASAEIAPLEPRPFTAPLGQLKEKALALRPDLETRRAGMRLGEAQADIERMAIYPDIMVKGAYKDMRQSHHDEWSVMVGIKGTLAPWALASRRAAMSRAEALRRQGEREYAAQRSRVESEVEAAYARLQSAWRRLRIQEDGRMPLSEQALRSSLAALAGGRGDMAQALAVFRETRSAREAALAAKIDHLMAWSQLAYALGGDPNQAFPQGVQP